MEQAVDKIDKKDRYREMGRVLSNIFLNVHNHGIDPNYRAEVEKDLRCWNKEEEQITFADLAEFMFQVGGCIFLKKNEEVVGSE